jgi:hypothetical protein
MAVPETIPALPDRIGTVRIVGRIGQGAMGEVFRGEDEALGRAVAVKLLGAVEDNEALVRFDREAVALARLHHPNVVAVFHKGMVGHRPYFTMELVEGPTVQNILDGQGAFAVGEALEVVRQAALGLQAAAQAGVTHRDVKPANLLVAKDGTVKVADFGVCKMSGPGPDATQDGTTLGTPFYMAPEQARGEAVDPRADQYALGATLYHLLSGRPPYGAQQTVAQLLAHQKEPVPDICAVVPDLPPGVGNVITRMMAKEKAERFGDYDELLEAIDHALEPEAIAPKPWRARAMAAVALAASVAGVGLFLLDTPARQEPVTVVVEPVLPPVVTVVQPPAPPPVVEPTPPAAVENPPPRPDEVKADEVTAWLSVVETGKGTARSTAMRSLARSGDGRARAALERVVVNSRDEDAPLAALLLGELGDQAATDALVKALGSSRRSTVLAAVDALSLLRDVRAVEPLRELSTHHADATVRVRAARAGTLLFAVEKEP